MATYSLSPAQGVKAAERYASYSFPYPDVRLAFPAAMSESGLPFPVTRHSSLLQRGNIGHRPAYRAATDATESLMTTGLCGVAPCVRCSCRTEFLVRPRTRCNLLVATASFSLLPLPLVSCLYFGCRQTSGRGESPLSSLITYYPSPTLVSARECSCLSRHS